MHLLRLLPRFREAHRHLDVLAGRERWSRAGIATWQLERLNQVWRHASAHVPYYRRLAADVRLPEQFRSLQEYTETMPILPRLAIKTAPEDLLSDRAAPGQWHVSSGSTGNPTRYFIERAAHREMLQCRYRMQASWGIDILDPTASLWSAAAEHTPGPWRHLAGLRQGAVDLARNRLRLSAYHMSPADLRAHLGRLAAFQPAMLYAYSTAGYLLAREAEATAFRCDRLELCVLSAEPASPHMVATVERAFGVPAVVEYGATECALIAGEGPDRVLRVREDLVFVETRPIAGGGHELLLTVLNNPSFPFLRYAIGDITDRPIDTPEKGFAVLSNVTGRSNDLLATRTGRVLHPLRFEFLFSRSLAKAVRYYRIHQARDGSVSAVVSASEPVPARDLARLKQELEALLEGYPVTVQLVDALPDQPRKHRWTTSDMLLEPNPLLQTADTRGG